MRFVFCLCHLSLALAVPHIVNIDNTKPRLDINGNIINAHDGSYKKFGDYYYYHAAEYGLCREPPKYGCDLTPDRCGFHDDHNVSIWRSPDLSSGSWAKIGTAVQCKQLEGCGILYRPHLVFNPNTKKYVLFVNYVGKKDNGDFKGYAVYSSDSPAGGFRLENPSMNVSRLCPGPAAGPVCGKTQGRCGDFTVFVDSRNGQGYMMYSCNHYMGIEKLTASYYYSLSPSLGNRNASIPSGLFGGNIFPDYFIEAPVMFKRGDIYYALYGHCCCFCQQGSGIIVFTAETPMGPWIKQPGGNIACVPPGDVNHESVSPSFHFNGVPTPGQGCLYNGSDFVSTTNAQQNFVIEVQQAASKGSLFIWTGDLWQQAPDGIKGHEGQFWVPLRFDATGRIEKVKHVDSFEIEMENTDFEVYWNVNENVAPKVDVTEYGYLPRNYTQVGAGCTTPHCKEWSQGVFPTVSSSGKIVNGGVPQNGDLELHLNTIIETLPNWIPDPNWNGNAVLDFEAWTTIWDFNEGEGDWHSIRYQNYSIELVRAKHPKWDMEKIVETAKYEFESAATTWFVQTLETCKRLRPRAKWGFYGLPLNDANCTYNLTNHQFTCGYDLPGPSGKILRQYSNKQNPIWEASTALFPSIYIPTEMKGNDAKAKAYMYSVVKETIRCAKNAPGPMRPVLPYGWDHYHNGANVLSVETLKNQLQVPCDLGASGLVEWGNSKQEANESYWKWFVREGSGAITKKFVCDRVY
jgi:hyaluronoglucosaminidase